MTKHRRTDEEIDRLVNENMGIAAHIAKQFEFGLGRDESLSTARVGLLRAAKNYVPELGTFGTYASVAIRNALKNKWRAAHTKKRGGGCVTVHIEELQTFGCDVCDGSPRPDTIAMKHDDFQLVRGLLLKLPRSDRFIIQARYMRERPAAFEQLAHQLHVTRQDVHFRCGRILRTLRKMIQKETAN